MLCIPFVSHPNYSFNFPAKHRFPMDKFGLLQQRVRDLGLLTDDNLYTPSSCSAADLSVAHCPHYIRNFDLDELDVKAMRRMGLPWSEGLRTRTFLSPNGTLLAAELALEHGIACHLAGGTHHAHYEFGSGFCIFNDLAYAARKIILMGKARRILIFDCDVHQGDGTAAILQQDDDIYTCSVHCEKNFPHRKSTSNFDVGLSKGLSDSAYLDRVSETLAHCFTTFQPDFVLYDAGVDVWQHDPLGLLDISLDGIRRRERRVLNYCKDKRVPVATVIGGGYDKNQVALAQRHCIVAEVAHEVFVQGAN
ncbi:histone deacetylase family protein [Echinimonas agarilytica]|uniref:Histone deacetylase n=1 Tax=Echinimonas agarilytica TaxID=1215918 RepID=A0AA42B8G4_9GAMM|nr:histone deacetylase [Echinimonas agarilytica]MCM2680513.1 histone deacetylase [Echinimonas agarilytica]